MIKYKYNLIQDLKILSHNNKNKAFLHEKGLVYFSFSLHRFFKILYIFFTKKLVFPKINTDKKIICYIVTSGTWGAYELPDKVYILPWKLENMNLEELINHEVKHLELENYAIKNKLSHEEKEEMVNSFQCNPRIKT